MLDIKVTTEAFNDAIDEEDGGSGDEVEEEEDDTEEDNAEAFNDIEDEDLICANYISAPRVKMLPHAVVIGARKGGTRKFLKASIIFALSFNP